MAKMNSKTILLVIAIALIVGAIAWLQHAKSGSSMMGERMELTAPPMMEGNTSQAMMRDDDRERIAAKEQRYPRGVEISNPTGFVNSEAFNLSEHVGKRVIIVDFWTYSCINCQRTLPYLTSWDEKYRDDGLLIVGIHTPEFEFEKDIDNVRKAVEKFGVEYPVV
jgi:thiol-disulfide isomerase/thioredoxin